MGYSWQFALTAVLLEGLIFILLTVTNLREKIVDALPLTLKNAIGSGIGLFIAFLGLQNAGIIVNNDATLISLGKITSGAPLLGLIGLLITSILLIKKVRGALLLGILLTTVIGIPMGVTHLDGIVSAPPSMEPIFMQFQWEHIFTKEMVIVVFTFLFVDMFDTIGTLVGVSTKSVPYYRFITEMNLSHFYDASLSFKCGRFVFLMMRQKDTFFYLCRSHIEVLPLRRHTS